MAFLLRKFLPECMYGGMDGLITTFAIIVGAFGAGFDTTIIIVLGLASIFADAFSMAASNYVSQKSSCHIKLTNDDGICEPGLAFKTAVATFLSFMVAGFITIFPFLLSLFSNHFSAFAIYYSVALTFVLFFLIGFFEGKISKQNAIAFGIRTFVIGIIAASVAFGTGWFIESLII